MLRKSRRAFLRNTVLFGCTALAAACAPAAAPAPATSPPAPTTPPAAAPTSPAAATAKPAAPTSAPAQPTLAPTATPKPTAATAAVKPVEVKAAWVAKTANQMVWPLAKDAGYFDKYGVSFDLNYINGSANGIAALVAKDLAMASVAGSAIVSAQAAGQDIIMVAGFLNQAVFRIMAIDLQTIDEVKGKTVAVTRVGQADYYAWQTVIERQKWSQDDVTFVNANDVMGQVGLLQQGAVQAIAVSPPNDVLARKVGAHLLLDTATLNEPEQNVGMGVTRAYLNDNRPTVTSVVKASIEAMARWKKDAAFTKGVIQKYLESTDAEFTNVGYDAYGPVWPQAPYPSRDGMAKVIMEVTSQNPKAKDLNVDQLIDASVVKELEASGFIKQVYAG
jgi:ABC-type nitrate/sulfonate/bicarbonate transport system substrate-binding protein